MSEENFDGLKVMVIDDSKTIRRTAETLLQKAGCTVITATDGFDALSKIADSNPAIIFVDIMMPRLDGFALCAELRRLAHAVPVLMLTAKGQIDDRVKGLDVGADDYLVKPFSTEELLARVRALLRRTRKHAVALTVLALGEARIDFVQQRAWRGKKPLHLTAKEFAMLRLMAECAGEAISRERFLDAVWGYTAFPTTRTVDNPIASLRGKIERNPDQPQWIKTVHGVGYRLELPEDKVP